MRVLAALSGGVDSAVAAARIRAGGHQVTGVHLALHDATSGWDATAGCASPVEDRDASRVAHLLGIPFEVWDFSQLFVSEVVDDFLAEYAAGRTPNPCLRCNRRIKFHALLERGLSAGFDAVATGHYARLGADGSSVSLHRATDTTKDQSYVLGVLDQHQLSHCLFPLGETTKEQVRQEALRLGLEVANKPDSLDICFIPDGDTPGFLTRAMGRRPGRIVDTAGTEVGSHDGHYQFTIGQRRGLRLGRPARDGQPRYVVGVDPGTNTVTVGAGDELLRDRVLGVRPTWTQRPVPGPWRGFAQLRAHGAPLAATFEVGERDGAPLVRCALDRPVRGVAPGQAMVMYDGDRVVGSATISATSCTTVPVEGMRQ